MNKIPAIISLRGLLATAVCFFHFVTANGGYISDPGIIGIFGYGSLAVPLFFVISGIVLPISMMRTGYQLNQWGSFMKKRLLRLEPPFLASLLLALLYYFLRPLVAPVPEGFSFPGNLSIFLHVAYLVPFVENAQWVQVIYWTLAVEFQYYLLLSLVFPLAISGNNLWRYIFYLVFLALPFTVSSYEFLPVHASLFLTGIAYALYRYQKIWSVEFILVLAVSLLVGLATLPPLQPVLALFLVAFVHYFPRFINRPLAFLGRISYSMYLLHAITGSILINLLARFFHEPWQKPLVIIAGFAITLILSYILYRLIEKPSMAWSKKNADHKNQPREIFRQGDLSPAGFPGPHSGLPVPPQRNPDQDYQGKGIDHPDHPVTIS